MFLKHWQSPGQANSLARVALSWAQFQVDTGTSLLTECTTALPHMEALWFASMRGFLRCIDGRIEVDNAYILPLQREHDYFTSHKIKRINYCAYPIQFDKGRW
jgi:hypothetical protein